MYVTPIRTHVNIMGHEIPVIIDDEKCDLAESDGLYEAEAIYLKSSYVDIKEYYRVYRHEAFHALCDLLGIQLDHHTEEILAHRVSYMMTYEI